MLLADSQQLALEFESRIPSWDVPVEYFAFASGTLAEHEQVSAWFSRYIDLNLEILAAKLEDVWDRNPLGADAVAVVELARGLPESVKARTFWSPQFTRWLNDAFDFTCGAADGGNLDQALATVLSLPLLLLEQLDEVGLSFETPVFVPERLCPIGGSWSWTRGWGRWGTLTVAAGRPAALAERLGTRTLRLTPRAVEDFDTNLGVVSRRYVPGTDIELVHHEHFPFQHFDLSTCHSWGPGPGIERSLHRSLELLESAWPEAVPHLACYARVIVPYVPTHVGRHNSCTIRRYLFAQGTDVVAGQELQNLASMIHESMHSKLHVMLSGQVLYWNRNDDNSFRHPWMDIPRPIRGVFLGAHAFINILSMCRRVMDLVPEWSKPAEFLYRETHPQVGVALEELKRGDNTELGDRLRAAMADHYRELS